MRTHAARRPWQRPLAFLAALCGLVVLGCSKDSPSPSAATPPITGADSALTVVLVDSARTTVAGEAQDPDPRSGFTIDDFSQASDLVRLVGRSTVVGPVLQLTDAGPGGPAATWTAAKYPIGLGFETTFDFRVTVGSGGGADGLAFVIQDTAADALGGTGGGLGYAGLARSLAVELDFWNNGLPADSSDHHIAVHSLGTEPNAPETTAPLAAVTTATDLSDGLLHTLRIRYVPGTLSVFLDGAANAVLTVPVDLTNIGGASILDADQRAWVGFTASTGVFTESHEILRWTFTPTIPGTPPVVDHLKAVVLPPGIVTDQDGNPLSGVWLRVRLTDADDATGPWDWDIDWGDSTVTSPKGVALKGEFAFLRQAMYTAPGPHTITVIATDPGGLKSTPATTTVP